MFYPYLSGGWWVQSLLSWRTPGTAAIWHFLWCGLACSFLSAVVSSTSCYVTAEHSSDVVAGGKNHSAWLRTSFLRYLEVSDNSGAWRSMIKDFRTKPRTHDNIKRMIVHFIFSCIASPYRKWRGYSIYKNSSMTEYNFGSNVMCFNIFFRSWACVVLLFHFFFERILYWLKWKSYHLVLYKNIFHVCPFR